MECKRQDHEKIQKRVGDVEESEIFCKNTKHTST
jgi:hypothetical protein